MVEFKQTDIGQLPNDWECVTLGELFNITSSKRVFQSDWCSSGIPFYRARELAVLSETGKVDNELFITLSLYDKYIRDYGSIQPDDILITGVGTLGKVYVVKNGDKFYFKDGNIIWLKTSGKVVSMYVMQQFHFSLLLNQVFGTSAGSTVGTYTITNAKATQIPLPPLPEQRAIAAALSDVDGYIAALERLIAKKRNIKKGAMQELLTGKRRLPGFEGEWVEKPFSELFDFYGGLSASREQLSTKGYPYLHYGDIHGATRIFVDVGTDRNIPCLDVNLNKVSNTSLLQNGDVVFVDASEDDEGASRHIVVRNENGKPFISGLHTIIARSKTNQLDNRFKEFCFQTAAVKAQFKFYAVGTKVTGVNKTTIGRIILDFPADCTEQSAIVTILSDMDAEIDALTEKLTKVRNIKQGMMQELLTGRIRLVDEEAEITPVAKVVPLKPKDTEAAKSTKNVAVAVQKAAGHNTAIEDAVILAAVTERYATEQYPLAPFYAQKFSYLLHRHMEGLAKGYAKKAAGPYNAALKYKTALPIALKNRYVVAHDATYKGHSFVNLTIGEKIAEAKNYFNQWHGDEPLQWLEQFRYIKNRRDELELLTTTDKAIVELRDEGKAITLQAVKEIIKKSPEWKDKLKRAIFSDDNIARAIRWSNELFETGAKPQ